MQKVKHSRDFFARSVYYGSKLYSLQLKRGDETYNIPPVYVIGIMEGHLRHSTDRECVVRYTMSRNDGVEVAPKTISCIFAQLGFFDRKEEECRDLLDQWLYSLKHMKSLETIPEGFDDGEMSPLFAAADPSKFSEDKLISYNKAMMYERDYTSDMYYSRQEGREEGRAEATLANAKSLKAAGFPVEAIAQALDLTEAQVDEL